MVLIILWRIFDFCAMMTLPNTFNYFPEGVRRVRLLRCFIAFEAEVEINADGAFVARTVYVLDVLLRFTNTAGLPNR